MIFSLSLDSNTISPQISVSEFDIYCFFHVENSISLVSFKSEIITSILSSLRQKKGVLILDSNYDQAQDFNFNRGVRAYKGSGLIYLAPHSHSLLLTQISSSVHSFHDLMDCVLSSKLLKS